MILGIDAFNIKDGGGVTHLVELLKEAKPNNYEFDTVIIWGDNKLLTQIDDRPWLIKKRKTILEKNIVYRLFWHRFLVKKEALENNCSVLFCPGGVSRSSFKPRVTMSRNLLPFETKEMLRYGSSLMTLKLIIIRLSQRKSFIKSQGVIFLTNYAKDLVTSIVNINENKIALIPHGVSSIINNKSQSKKNKSNQTGFNLLYVSHIRPYKHHLNVAKAIVNLRKRGFDVSINFIGSEGRGYKEFLKFITTNDPGADYLKYNGGMPRREMENFYLKADICLFASSCENMPNILLEAMTANLPIVCSNKGPMPEILGDAGIYFNPEKISSIEGAIEKIIRDDLLRKKIVRRSKEKIQKYNWAKCADQTFSFLKKIAVDE